MKQTATAAEEHALDRSGSAPKPWAISMRIDLADQPLFHKTDATFDPYPMSDTEEPD